MQQQLIEASKQKLKDEQQDAFNDIDEVERSNAQMVKFRDDQQTLQMVANMQDQIQRLQGIIVQNNIRLPDPLDVNNDELSEDVIEVGDHLYDQEAEAHQ